MERKVVRSYETGTSLIAVELLEGDEVKISSRSSFSIVDGTNMSASFIADLFKKLTHEAKALRRRLRNSRKRHTARV